MLYECKTVKIADNCSIQVGIAVGLPVAEEDEYGQSYEREIELILFVPTKDTIDYLLSKVDQEVMDVLWELRKKVSKEHAEMKSRIEEWALQSDKNSQQRMEGFIYILRADNNTYKIGRTKTIHSRIESIDGTLPYATELVHTIEALDYKEAERYFHQKFADRCIRGEWFQLTEEDIEDLKQITSYPFEEDTNNKDETNAQ